MTRLTDEQTEKIRGKTSVLYRSKTRGKTCSRQLGPTNPIPSHRCPAMCMVKVIDAGPPRPWSVSGTTPSLASASRSDSLEDTSKVFVEVQEARCRHTPSTLPWSLKAPPPNTKAQALSKLIAVLAHMSPSDALPVRHWSCPGGSELRRRAPPPAPQAAE